MNKDDIASYSVKENKAKILKFQVNDDVNREINDETLRILAKMIKSAETIERLDIDCSK